jgi:PAS domain S-box-containing protein
VLAILLHVLWFRRTARLTATVAELGAARLDARARLAGRDELAGIGAAIDRMADELQVRQSQLRQLESLVIHSPVVIITWRNLPNRPVTFVSENIRQWGYSPAELLSGKIQYTDLIHHADLPRLERDVADHHAHGPDEYRQEYRLRHADGHWLWIVDRTWLTRDASGAVANISGALTDISDRHRLAEAQRQQSAILSERNEELERFNRAMVGRELDMIRLKQQVNELSQQLGQEPPYAVNLTDPIVPAQALPAGISRTKGRGA